MLPPEALKILKGLVLLLLSSLYGLKQSGREWYIEAAAGLKTLGFSPCFSEPSVFISADCSIIIGLYVNDRNTLIAGQPGEVQANQSLYQEAIGYTTWVSKGSRPDITYTVG
jgi:hypothetical protein